MRKRLAVVAASLAACAMPVSMMVASPVFAQKAGGTLHISHRENPPSASIHEETTISVNQPFMAVFNNLVVFDPNEKVNSPDKIVPDLAESWSWDASKTKLTFKLRSGVKWHDGKPFTSKDVKCTFDAVSGLDEKSDIMRKSPRKIWYINLKDVSTNGDNEVTFTLGRPQPSFLSILAAGYSPVYSCHVPGRDMRTKPIGTGPFKVAEFKRNEVIKLVKNPDYFKKGRPYLDVIDWKIVPNRSTRMLGFQTGQFDMTFDSDVSFPMLKDVMDQKKDAVCEARPTNVRSDILINRDAPPFDNPDIRRAMVDTIDFKAFSQILSQGHHLEGAAMLPPPYGVWGMPKEMLATLPGHATDIAKSRAEGKAIMEKLGYSAAKPLKIKVATRNIAIYRDLYRGRARGHRLVGLVQQDRQEGLSGRHEPDRWRRRRPGHVLLRELLFEVGAQLHRLQQSRGRQIDRAAVGRDRHRQAQEDGVGDREEAGRRRRASGDRPQCRQHLLGPEGQGPQAAGQQHL
jgi:peptide/nickel transport system substrate-binding protein